MSLALAPALQRSLAWPGEQPGAAAGASLGAVVFLTLALTALLGDPHRAEPRAVAPILGAAAVIELNREDHGGHPAPEAAHAPAAAPSAPGGLASAPIAGLTAPGPHGPLPVIAADGRAAWRAYARPFADPLARPRIAILVTGLGLDRAATERAIRELPPDITLAFSPYAEDLQGWIDQARDKGHEVALAAPMEPFDYPASDPGPLVLLADAEAADAKSRLERILSRASGYFAVVNHMGARYTAAEPAMTGTLEALASRGVAFLHDGETRRAGLGALARQARAPFAAADRVIDAAPSAAEIDLALLRLEAQAIENGAALGSASPLPVSLDQLGAWAKTLPAKGYALAPASALITPPDAVGPPRAAAPEPVATQFETVAASFGRTDKAAKDKGHSKAAGAKKPAKGGGH